MDLSSSSVESSMNDSLGGAGGDGDFDTGNQQLQQRLEKGKEALAKILSRESIADAARRGAGGPSSYYPRVAAPLHVRSCTALDRGQRPAERGRISSSSQPPRTGAGGRPDGGRAMELDISSDNEERFLRKEVSPVGSSAHRMLEVEQMNESLLKEIQQVDEINQELYKENREQAMVLEQLRNELRRRSEETEDERDLLFQRMQDANKLREDAVGNFESAVSRMGEMAMEFEEDIQREQDRVHEALQRQAELREDAEAASEERAAALRRAAEAERELQRAHRETAELRAELREVREEATAVRAKMEEQLRDRETVVRSSTDNDALLQQERKARLSLQLYLESVAATVVRDARSAKEEFMAAREDLEEELTRSHDKLTAALAANEKMRADGRGALAAVEEQVTDLQGKIQAVAKDLEDTRRREADGKARAQQACSVLKSRVAVLEAAGEVSERRQAALTERVRARDEALNAALSRIQRLSDVETEQGKVDWDAEIKQLRAQIKVLDALPDPMADGAQGAGGRGSGEAAPVAPMIVKNEDGVPLISNLSGEMGRKRRRYAQPESPQDKAPEGKTASGSWLGKLLFGS